MNDVKNGKERVEAHKYTAIDTTMDAVKRAQQTACVRVFIVMLCIATKSTITIKRTSTTTKMSLVLRTHHQNKGT